MLTARILSIIIILSSVFMNTASATDIKIASALKEIDEAIENHQKYITNYKKELEEMKHDIAVARFEADRHLAYKNLYEAYKKFDGDSALVYAQRCYNLGKSTGNINWMKEGELDAIKLYIIRGQLSLAQDMLNNFGDIESIPKELRPELAMAYINLARRTTSEKPVIMTHFQPDMDYYWNKYSKYIPKESTLYLAAMSFANKPYNDIITLCERLIRNIKTDCIRKGNIYNAMAIYYKKKGNKQLYLYYILKAGASDIRNCNRGSEALPVIIDDPNANKNIDRAYAIARICDTNARAFKDANRSLKIISAHDIIIRKYQMRKQAVRHVLILVLALVCILFLCTVYMVMKIRKQRHKLERQNRLLDLNVAKQKESIEVISQMTDELHLYNDKLKEEIKLRDDNFLTSYYMSSDYIKAYLDFRKRIANLIKTNSMKAALHEASCMSVINAEIERFYMNFDKAFLATHTDFVERMNRLMRPEQQFKNLPQGSLTPELRIYALTSLGITSNITIADFLQYTPQTIYNYRHRVKRGARTEEKDFDYAIAHLYDDRQLETVLNRCL